MHKLEILLSTSSYFDRISDNISFGTNALFWLIAGILFSIIVSVASQLLIRYIRRPQLTTSELAFINQGAEQIAFVRVTNKGRQAAENCTASLAISEINAGSVLSASANKKMEPIRKHPVNDSLSANLCWAAPENGASRHLNRNESAMVWVFKIGKEGNIIFPSELGWEPPSVILSRTNAPYNVTIQITSKVAQSHEAELEIDH